MRGRRWRTPHHAVAARVAPLAEVLDAPAGGAPRLDHFRARVLEQPVVVRLGRVVRRLIALAERRVEHTAESHYRPQVGQAAQDVLHRQVREQRMRPRDVRPRRQAVELEVRQSQQRRPLGRHDRQANFPLGADAEQLGLLIHAGVPVPVEIADQVDPAPQRAAPNIEQPMVAPQALAPEEPQLEPADLVPQAADVLAVPCLADSLRPMQVRAADLGIGGALHGRPLPAASRRRGPGRPTSRSPAAGVGPGHPAARWPHGPPSGAGAEPDRTSATNSVRIRGCSRRRSRAISARKEPCGALATAADCRRLSRQSQLHAYAAARAHARAGARNEVGYDGNCRVSVRQCATVERLMAGPPSGRSPRRTKPCPCRAGAGCRARRRPGRGRTSACG